MNRIKALQIANKVLEQLKPHCERIRIAGSIRRGKPYVKDIEIVAIPKPYEVGLFESGIATIVNQWTKVKGELPCKYTQRELPEGIKLDLFFATPENWGYILAIRTGSAAYNQKVLAYHWVRKGYKGIDGMLTYKGKTISVPTEVDLFKLIGIDYVEPNKREV